MDLFPVAGNEPGTDRLFTRLSDLIGLQRKVVMGAVCIIQLAGHIDRDDIFSNVIQGMIAKRKNLLIDFRQVKYMGPYIRRVLDDLNEKAADLHLKVGLISGPCLSETDMQSWTNQPMTPFQVFQDEKNALKVLNGGLR